MSDNARWDIQAVGRCPASRNYVKTGSHRGLHSGRGDNRARPGGRSVPKGSAPKPQIRKYPKKLPRQKPPIPKRLPGLPQPSFPSPVGLSNAGKIAIGRILSFPLLTAQITALATSAIVKALIGTGAWSHPRYNYVQCTTGISRQPPSHMKPGAVAGCNIGVNMNSTYIPAADMVGTVNVSNIGAWKVDGYPFARPSGNYQRIISGTSGEWSQDIDKYYDGSDQPEVRARERGSLRYPQIDPMQTPIMKPGGVGSPIPHRIIPHRRRSFWRVDQPDGSEPDNWPRPRPRPRPTRPGPRRGR